MSMTDATQAPSRKPKRRTRRVRRASTLPRKPAMEFAGITAEKCPAACNADRCVISGHGVCGHPHKGGLQGRDLLNGDATGRLNAAKRLLGKRQVDARIG